MSRSRIQVAKSESPKRRFDPLEVYAASLATIAFGIVAALITADIPLSTRGAAWPLVLFVALAVLVERESIPLTRATELSVAFLPLVFVEVVFGPLAAVLVGATTMITEFPRLGGSRSSANSVDRPYLRWLVWTSNRVVVAGVGGVLAQEALTNDGAKAVVLATAVATTANFTIDFSLTSLTLRIRKTERALAVLKAVARIAAAGIPIYCGVAALLAYAYIALTPLTAALFFVPAVAAHRLFAVTRKQQDALDELASANKRLESANLSFAAALVATLDARDRYTAGHSQAVAMYARDIAAEMGWDAAACQFVDLCGLVHDIGKIGLPPGLLEKPGALTPEERRQMEEHSAIGERILANVEGYAEVAVIVRHHHERFDSDGYPDGLAGTDIPVTSRILAVADAYDAMTSNRPYRAAMPSTEAQRRLSAGAGTQFDAEVVMAFLNVLARSDADYQRGRSARTEAHLRESEPVVALAS